MHTDIRSVCRLCYPFMAILGIFKNNVNAFFLIMMLLCRDIQPCSITGRFNHKGVIDV